MAIITVLLVWIITTHRMAVNIGETHMKRRDMQTLIEMQDRVIMYLPPRKKSSCSDY